MILFMHVEIHKKIKHNKMKIHSYFADAVQINNCLVPRLQSLDIKNIYLSYEFKVSI